MTNETWRDRFDEKFEDVDFDMISWTQAMNKLEEIKYFIQSEIDKALVEQKMEIVEIVSKYDGDLCYATGNIIKEINNLK